MLRNVGFGMLLGAVAFTVWACSGQYGQKGAIAALGCDVDATRLCEQGIGMAGNYGNVVSSSQDYLQQNAPSTASFRRDMRAPGGSAIDIECRENMQARKIVYASASPEGTFSDSDKQWLQQSGYCKDSVAADSTKAQQ